MARDEYADVRGLLEVACARTFTRAAARLGLTRSALSHTVRALEDRLGVRLLCPRTPRDVAPTAAGGAARGKPDPNFEGIAAEIGAPGYFARRPVPVTSAELTDHNCINLRLPTSGGLHEWEFRKDVPEFTVRVGGQLTLSHIGLAIDAARDDVGLAQAPREPARRYLESGQLQEVLADGCPTFRGYHLHYPSWHDLSQAFATFVEAFRFRSRQVAALRRPAGASVGGPARSSA